MTIALFGIDSEISHRQQSTIQQLVSHRRLTPAQKERLAAVVKKFPAQNFLTMTALDAESWDFVMEIGAELRQNGWNWIACDGPLPKVLPMDGRPASCWTVLDHIEVDGARAKGDIVHALVAALKDAATIGMDDARPVITEAFPTIAIMVGTKR